MDQLPPEFTENMRTSSIDIDAKMTEATIFKIGKAVKLNIKIDKQNMLTMSSVDSSLGSDNLIKLDGSKIDFTTGDMQFKVSAIGVTPALVNELVNYIDEDTEYQRRNIKIRRDNSTNFNDLENIKLETKIGYKNLKINGAVVAKNIDAKKI